MGDHRLAPSTLIAALDARAQHRRQSHGGVVVHWREWGQGPLLVLLHWVRNIGHWSQHFRVIVPDVPGFGDSQDFALAAHDPARLECVLQVPRHPDPGAARRLASGGVLISRKGQLPSALRHLTRPMLMVWGEADGAATPTEAAELLAPGREERAWIVPPKAGHWVQYESADAVNTLVTSWLLHTP